MGMINTRLKKPLTESQISLANRIRNKRLELGLSLQEVAEKLGISKVTLQRYETLDIVNIPAENIEKLALLYDVSPAYIMGWEEDNAHLNFVNNSGVVSTYHYVPSAVSAGALTNIEGISTLPTVSVPDFMMGRYAGNKNIILMSVNGESMNNVIQNGAIIAVLRNIELPDIHDGDIVVIKNGGDYTVKRFYNDKQHQEFVFKPDSSDMAFRDIIFSYENTDDLYLIGKVVMYNVTL